jgi:hypothetical protein
VADIPPVVEAEVKVVDHVAAGEWVAQGDCRGQHLLRIKLYRLGAYAARAYVKTNCNRHVIQS